MTTDDASSGGISATSALQLTFIVLKLTHLIAWSWWWVLAPAWISVGIVLVIIVFALIVGVILG